MTLRQFIAQAKLTQREAAQRLGVAEAQLSRYLSGHSKPRLETAAQIEKLSGGLVPVTSWTKKKNKGV